MQLFVIMKMFYNTKLLINPKQTNFEWNDVRGANHNRKSCHNQSLPQVVYIVLVQFPQFMSFFTLQQLRIARLSTRSLRLRVLYNIVVDYITGTSLPEFTVKLLLTLIDAVAPYRTVGGREVVKMKPAA